MAASENLSKAQLGASVSADWDHLSRMHYARPEDAACQVAHHDAANLDYAMAPKYDRSDDEHDYR